MNTRLLLQEIKLISNKYDLINQKTGGYFNIFEITNISIDEVKFCRILHELLSPLGSHYQGDTYLRLFIKNVLGLNLSEEEISSVKVYREYTIKNGRRIDIVIKTTDSFIPIEVKIYASDQKNQCYDYYKSAVKSNVYYLTRFGDSPSEYSAGPLTLKEGEYLEVTNISFEKDILNWLYKCLEDKETIKIASIRETILQLASAIRNFTQQMEDDKEMEMKGIIMASSESMRAGLEIEESLKLCKIAMVEKVFKAIESKVDREKLINEYDYLKNEGENVKEYYNRKRTYPGISYLYKSNIKKDIDIWIRIEIDHKIFIGYCVAVGGKAGRQVLSEDEIPRYINGIEPWTDDWWAYWEYLPNDQESTSPDFKKCNDAFINLFDEENFEKFIKHCVNRINELFDM